MTGQRGEGTAADPNGAGPDGPSQAGREGRSNDGPDEMTETARRDGRSNDGPDGMTETAGRVRAALEEIFGRIAPIGTAFAAQRRACLAAGTELTPDRLTGVREIIWHQLGLLPAADGAGIVAAPGVVGGRERHLEWWQRGASGDDAPDNYSRIRLNLDPESIDLYDYLDMDWFTVLRAEGRRYVYGPYIDFSGADRSILAMTIPVRDLAHGQSKRGGTGASAAGESGTGTSGDSENGSADSDGKSRSADSGDAENGTADGDGGENGSGDGEFLGVAGADIRMSHLEPALLAILRPLAAPAVLVTAERRVVAANTPRWIPGTRLDRFPRVGDDGFCAVIEIGADSGWLLAASHD
jgi:hypothetical protein